MKILVTGTGGFVGPHLVRELEQHGYDVVRVDRDPTKSDYGIDLSRRDEVEFVLRQENPDVVVHLAGWSHVGQSWVNPTKVFEANVICTLHLYEVFAQLQKRNARFLFVSSADVFGLVPAEQLPLTEKTPAKPESPYAVSKLAAEQALRLLSRRRGPAVLIARPVNHIGPGQSPNFACPSFARQVAEIEAGTRETLKHGNLQSRRDFIDVRDAVRAYRLILEKGRDGDLFVVASGHSYLMEGIVQDFFELAGLPASMELDPGLLRPLDMPEIRGSSDFLTERTGWAPEIPLAETLRSILEEARSFVRAEV